MLNVFLSHSVPSFLIQSLTDLIGLAGPQAPWVLIALPHRCGLISLLPTLTILSTRLVVTEPLYLQSSFFYQTR